MKRPLFSVFIVASLMVAIAHCFPGAAKPKDSEDGMKNVDTFIVLPNTPSLFGPLFGVPDYRQDDMDDSLENPIRGYDFWSDNSFSTLFSRMQNIMNRIQDQLASTLDGPGVFQIGETIPEGANTTSTTKVIDGHVFTLNKTTYEKSNNDSTVILRVNILDVHPVNETNASAEGEVDLGSDENIETLTTRVNGASDGETTTPPPRSVETVEDSAANEVPNKSENFDA